MVQGHWKQKATQTVSWEFHYSLNATRKQGATFILQRDVDADLLHCAFTIDDFSSDWQDKLAFQIWSLDHVTTLAHQTDLLEKGFRSLTIIYSSFHRVLHAVLLCSLQCKCQPQCCLVFIYIFMYIFYLYPFSLLLCSE